LLIRKFGKSAKPNWSHEFRTVFLTGNPAFQTQNNDEILLFIECEKDSPFKLTLKIKSYEI